MISVKPTMIQSTPVTAGQHRRQRQGWTNGRWRMSGGGPTLMAMALETPYEHTDIPPGMTLAENRRRRCPAHVSPVILSRLTAGFKRCQTASPSHTLVH